MSGECEKCGEHSIDCSCLCVPKIHVTRIPTARDPCQFCEHKEMLHMLLPRLEELEKKVNELEFNLGFHARLLNEFNHRLPKELDAKPDI